MPRLHRFHLQRPSRRGAIPEGRWPPARGEVWRQKPSPQPSKPRAKPREVERGSGYAWSFEHRTLGRSVSRPEASEHYVVVFRRAPLSNGVFSFRRFSRGQNSARPGPCPPSPEIDKHLYEMANRAIFGIKIGHLHIPLNLIRNAACGATSHLLILSLESNLVRPRRVQSARPLHRAHGPSTLPRGRLSLPSSNAPMR